jgi:uncharacterized membrane protein (UPF0127 family)
MAIQILKTNNDKELYITECVSFFDKFLGLMFRRNIAENEGIVFLYEHESILNATIHMLFMRFSITVIWVNKENIIVDKSLAKPWRFAYAPKKPANIIYELHETVYDEFNIGDKIKIK